MASPDPDLAGRERGIPVVTPPSPYGSPGSTYTPNVGTVHTGKNGLAVFFGLFGFLFLLIIFLGLNFPANIIVVGVLLTGAVMGIVLSRRGRRTPSRVAPFRQKAEQ